MEGTQYFSKFQNKYLRTNGLPVYLVFASKILYIQDCCFNSQDPRLLVFETCGARLGVLPKIITSLSDAKN